MKYNPVQLNFKRAVKAQQICELGGLIDKNAQKEAQDALVNLARNDSGDQL